MTPLIFMCLACAGGLGAMVRFGLDAVLNRRYRAVFPWATFIINVTGSLLLGLVSALSVGQLLNSEWALIVGAGFLGGYTTFSTNSYETVRLLGEKRYAASLASALGTLATCVAAAALGYWLGSILPLGATF